MSPEIFTNVINSYLPEPHASLLNGILFGIPLYSSGTFYEALKHVGLLHIVVLSGMNITLLASFCVSLLSSFSKIASVLITIFLIIIFIIFVGPQAPIVRAGIMGILTLVATVLGRKNIALYSLFTSGLIIALFMPEWIKSISFQLSFTATLGIILFSHTTNNYIKDSLRTTLAAQLLTTPIIFFYFKQISLISPLSNLLVLWLIEPLMILGFLTAIGGTVIPIAGKLLSWLCFGLLHFFITTVYFLDHIPYGYIQF